MPQKFIHEVADYLLDQEDLRDIAVIIPNKRAATYLSKSLSDKTKKPIWSPKMMTINEWVDDLTPERLITATEAVILLHQAYKKVMGDEAESFSDFFKWGNMLRNDFNEIEVYLLSHKDVYRNLKEIKDIEEWSFGKKDLSENQKKYLQFWEKLGLIYEAYKELLNKKQLQFFGGALRKLAENPLLIKSKEQYKHYVFAGFNALSKAEETIIDFFMKEKMSQVFWDVDRYYEQQPEHEAAYFYRKFKNKWNKEQMNLPGDWMKNSLKKVEIIGVPQYTLQSRLAASLLKNIPTNEHSQTAVVLGDEKLLDPFLSGIPKSIGELNVTMGLSLKNTPIKSLVDALFDIQFNYLKYKSFGKGVYYKDWFNFARHPYIKNIFPQLSERTENMHYEAVEKNYAFLKEQFLIKHEAEDALPYVKPWRKNHLHKDAFETIQKLIAHIKNWTVEKNLTFEAEIIQVFEEGTQRFHQLLEEYQPEINIGVYRNLFNHFWQNEKLAYEGSPIDHIQVMGLLETRMLDFKNIIFVAMNEDVIPKKAREQSMMPYDLKRYFQLPTRHERDAIFAHHFYRLLHRAENVTLIYNTENDDFGSGEKSRYITQLELELPKEIPSVKISNKTYFTEIKPSPEYKIEKSSNVLKRAQYYLSEGVSPSALNTFFSCELDFYYKYILNLGEDEEVEEEFSFSSFGTIVHDTLEALYLPYVNELITLEIIDLMIRQYPKELRTQTEKKFDEEYLSQGANHVYYEAAQVYIFRFLEQEKVWLKDHECRIISLEEKLTHEMSLNINGETVNIKLRGKADRIDEVDGEIIRIVDYKTGKVTSPDLLLYAEGDPKPKALQLAVYNLLYNAEGKKVTAGNISLQNPEDGFITVSLKEHSKGKKLDDEDIIPVTESIIIHFVEKLLNKDEPFVHNPSAEYCDYCL